jgi:hypothetical protein
VTRNRENRVKIGQNPQKRLEKRLRNGSETVRTSMDGITLTGWMYSSTMEDGTPGALSVAQILGCPCMGALAPKNDCKMAIGRGCVRPPPGPETAQKRLKLAPSGGACGGSEHVVWGPRADTDHLYCPRRWARHRPHRARAKTP